MKFSVITATHNRRESLERLHESLTAQTFKDFEWIIVDDGSSDGTADLAAAWLQDSPLTIQFLRQESGHKKAALNRALEVSRGELMAQVDDDDELPPSSLAYLAAQWEQIPSHQRESFVGITGLCARPDGQIMGDRYPYEPLDSTPAHTTRAMNIKGDKFGCQRINVLREFPFPADIPGLVPEGIVWDRIANAGFRTRYVNEVVRICHDSPQGLSRDRSTTALIDAAPGLYMLARSHVATWEPDQGIPQLLRASVNSSRFAAHARKRYGGAVLTRARRQAASEQSGKLLRRVALVSAWPAGRLLAARDLIYGKA